MSTEPGAAAGAPEGAAAVAGAAGDPAAADGTAADRAAADGLAADGLAADWPAANWPTADWPALRAAAREVAERAYAPYSGFQVGVAALVDDGRVVTGCNVENASYGLTLCAECGLVSALHASGGGRLVAFACVGGPDRRPTMPCGRCRQLLWEAGGRGLLVDTDAGPVPMSSLLPGAFDASELPPGGTS